MHVLSISCMYIQYASDIATATPPDGCWSKPSSSPPTASTYAWRQGTPYGVLIA